MAGQAAAVRFGPDAVAAGRLGPWLATMAMEGLTLAAFVPCGLPLALGCRRLWRLGYRRGAWTAGCCARRRDGGGDTAGRSARAGCDRGLRGRAQPAGLDRVVVACAERLTGDGAGPAAQQGRRRNRASRARQNRLGVGDPQFATAGGARLADDDFNVAGQRRQQPRQALQRILPEVPRSSRDTPVWVMLR